MRIWGPLGPPGSAVHMHNNLHVWVGGQMDNVPTTAHTL